MPDGFSDGSIAEITEVLRLYFNGLYDGDPEAWGRVFHPNAHLYASDGTILADEPLAQVLERIGARQSPRSRGLRRHDKILSIHKAGPNTALATVNCAIPPRYFTDYLSLLRTAEGWRVISKTYHTDIHE